MERERNITHKPNNSVARAIGRVARPWSLNQAVGVVEQTESLTTTVLEVSRLAGVSPEQVRREIPVSIDIGGSQFRIVAQKKAEAGISMKKIIRRSVGEPPIRGVRNGGRRLDETRLKRLKQIEQLHRTRLIFQRVSKDNQSPRAERALTQDRVATRLLQRADVFSQKHQQEMFLKNLLQLGEGASGSNIKRARWNNLEKFPVNGNVVVGFELCPLYTSGTTIDGSTLIANPTSEEDIIASRVGKKWIAIKQVLEGLHALVASHDRDLSVVVTFADIGVFAANHREARPDTVEKHAKLYNDCLIQILKDMGANCTFRRLSDISPTHKELGVKSFLIAEGAKTIQVPVTPARAAELLQLPNGMGKDPNQQALFAHLLEACNGNLEAFRGLVNTYINYQTTVGCNVHLGVERSDSLLALQSLSNGKLASLNILVG